MRIDDLECIKAVKPDQGDNFDVYDVYACRWPSASSGVPPDTVNSSYVLATNERLVKAYAESRAKSEFIDRNNFEWDNNCYVSEPTGDQVRLVMMSFDRMPNLPTGRRIDAVLLPKED